MAKTHITDDGVKACEAKTQASCTAKLNGQPSPHFEDENKAKEFYQGWLKSKHSAFASHSRASTSAATKEVSKTTSKSATSTVTEEPRKVVLPTSVIKAVGTMDSRTLDEVHDYAASSPEACAEVSEEINKRMSSLEWESRVMGSLRPQSGSPVTEKTFSLLQADAQAERRRTDYMLDAYMNSPHYRSNVKVMEPKPGVDGPIQSFPDMNMSCLWQRKMLDDLSENHETSSLLRVRDSQFKPEGGFSAVGVTQHGDIYTVSTYPNASSSEWSNGVPQHVTEEAKAAMKREKATMGAVVTIVDGHKTIVNWINN